GGRKPRRPHRPRERDFAEVEPPSVSASPSRRRPDAFCGNESYLGATWPKIWPACEISFFYVLWLSSFQVRLIAALAVSFLLPGPRRAGPPVKNPWYRQPAVAKQASTRRRTTSVKVKVT